VNPLTFKNGGDFRIFGRARTPTRTSEPRIPPRATNPLPYDRCPQPSSPGSLCEPVRVNGPAVLESVANGRARFRSKIAIQRQASRPSPTPSPSPVLRSVRRRRRARAGAGAGMTDLPAAGGMVGPGPSPVDGLALRAGSASPGSARRWALSGAAIHAVPQTAGSRVYPRQHAQLGPDLARPRPCPTPALSGPGRVWPGLSFDPRRDPAYPYR
jgi:hypothetical protein